MSVNVVKFFTCHVFMSWCVGMILRLMQTADNPDHSRETERKRERAPFSVEGVPFP